MKLVLMALAVSSAMTPGAANAADGDKTLQLRPKAAMMPAITSITPAQNAPFTAQSGAEPEVPLFGSRQDNAQEATRSACSSERALCYDTVSGRVVYKPARQLMPNLPGLRPENISLKRTQIVFRYSF